MRPRRVIPCLVCFAVAITLSAATVAADETASLEESLRAAEIAFAATAAARDIEAFGAMIDEEAIFSAGRVLNGRAAIVEGWSAFFAEDGPKIEWQPETVVVRADGRLGISQGPYVLTIRMPDGQENVQKGQFISIWERQDNGSWKIIFDSGCPPCPDCAGP